MIATLAFGSPVVDASGRLVRSAAFASRSNLPLSAVCLVANGVRESLARLLACEFDVELFEPAVPDSIARRTLLARAVVYRVRGKLGDAFVIVRPADAAKLVARAFGEVERANGELSTIERATLERIVHGIAPLCAPLVGAVGNVALENAERASSELVSYFEVRALGASSVAIGFALTYDPPPAVVDRLTVEDLAEVELRATVDVGSGALAVPAFSRLAPGIRVALDAALDGDGCLRFGDVRFARVRCGERGGRRAFAFAEHAA